MVYKIYDKTSYLSGVVVMLTALSDLFVAILDSYAGNLLSKIDSKHCSFKMKS